MLINDYKLVWSDEFNKGAIDTNTWGIYTQKYGENSDSSGLAFIKDNMLYIGKDKNDKQTLGVSGCEVNTKKSLYFKYGYLEIKAKLAKGPASFSAFWLNSAGLPFDRLPEIDIYENFGKDDRLAHNLHRWWYDKDDNGNQIHTREHLNHDQFAMQTHWTLRNSFLPDGEFFYEKFHRIGLNWTPEKMEFMIDGHCQVSIDITGDYFKDFHQPMYIILSHDLHTDREDIDSTANPSYDIIDYIRLYQDKSGVLQDKRNGEIKL